MNRLDQEKVKVGRWWWAVAVHMVLRCIASTVHQPGVVNIASCVVATLASLLGIRMIRLFQQTYEARALTPQPA